MITNRSGLGDQLTANFEAQSYGAPGGRLSLRRAAGARRSLATGWGIGQEPETNARAGRGHSPGFADITIWDRASAMTSLAAAQEDRCAAL